MWALLTLPLHTARAEDGQPQAPTSDIAKEFENLAEESSYFAIKDALGDGRPGFTRGLSAAEYAKYTAFITRFQSVPVSKEELIPLLRHPNPKVRTLAIAALARLDDPTVLPAVADLLADDSLTFATHGQTLQTGGYVPPLRKDVTVGENAQEVLFSWLGPAGYNGYQIYQILGKGGHGSRKEFDDYWSKHKGRDYCASWFAVRLIRASNGAVPGDTVKQAVHAELDKVPQPDRTWIALWLKEYNLDSEKELVEMCKKLGPDALMSALKKAQFPTDDPDLQKEVSHFANARDLILQNAGSLLRSQDSNDLIALGSGKNASPQWLIAASRLQPAKAVEILQQGYGNFDDDYDYSRFQLLAALWEQGGEEQTPFIVDKFYDIAQRSNDFSGDTHSFIGWVIDAQNPPGPKLIASILQDKRVDALKTQGRALAIIASAVNSWAKKAVVSDEELAEARKGVPTKMTTPLPAPNFALRVELLHRMRDTAPQWNH